MGLILLLERTLTPNVELVLDTFQTRSTLPWRSAGRVPGTLPSQTRSSMQADMVEGNRHQASPVRCSRSSSEIS